MGARPRARAVGRDRSGRGGRGTQGAAGAGPAGVRPGRSPTTATCRPKSELDLLYNKLAHFYRADCLYDSGRYEDAIRQYDAAAFRYQDDPSSLAAYVQIVNAYYALGKPDEARAANERAKVMLRQMPAQSFSNDTFAMPKEYWENQLRWASGAGMW